VRPIRGSAYQGEFSDIKQQMANIVFSDERSCHHGLVAAIRQDDLKAFTTTDDSFATPRTTAA
jgi:hypothetical protein